MPATKRSRSPAPSGAKSRRKLDLSGKTKKAKTTARATIRKTLLDLSDQKRFDYRYDHPGGLGNGGWKIDKNIFTRITSGTANNNRIGDEIYVQNVEISGVLQLPGDRPNTIVRMVATLTDFAGMPLEENGFPMRILPAFVGAWIANALDEDKQTIKYDKMIVNNLAAQTEIVGAQRAQFIPFHVVIPFNKKLHYKEANMLTGINALNVGYVAVDGRGGSADSIGFVYTQVSIFFKDV